MNGGEFDGISDLKLSHIQGLFENPNLVVIRDKLIHEMLVILQIPPIIPLSKMCYDVLTKPNMYGDISKKLADALDIMIADHIARKEDNGVITYDDALLDDVDDPNERVSFIDSTGYPRIFSKRSLNSLRSKAVPPTEHADSPIMFPESISEKYIQPVEQKRPPSFEELTDEERMNQWRTLRRLRKQNPVGGKKKSRNAH